MMKTVSAAASQATRSQACPLPSQRNVPSPHSTSSYVKVERRLKRGTRRTLVAERKGVSTSEF